MPACAILLSTYNGARFLDALLASLVAQSETDWLLLWRDDGSADETVAILEDWTQRLGPRCRRLAEPSGNLGVLGSFMTLLAAGKDFPHIAFADQDDIWLPEKLAWGLARLREVPEGTTALYCARQVLVDEALNRRGLSAPLRGPAEFPASLTQNIATGNTVILNAAAIRLVTATAAPPETWHDWWCYLIVTAAGGRVLLDDRGVILYRQHGGNAVGAAGPPMQRAIAALRRGPAAFMAVFRANIRALQRYDHLLSPAARRDLAVVAKALSGGPITRLHALRLSGLRRETPAQTALFRLWFLIG
jgi:glycosyltransferase involved in cell wall biosynthesis